METETGLIGSIGAVAVAVVEPDPREGARAVPASDHLRREVRLILGRNADERWRGVGGAGEEEEVEECGGSGGDDATTR